MTKNKKRQVYRFEQGDITWVDDKYFRVNQKDDATFFFRGNLTKYDSILKKSFSMLGRFYDTFDLLLSEILHQNLNDLLWDSQEEHPDTHLNSQYLNAQIPYSFKGIEKSQDIYAFYHSFCSKRTLKKYLNILEEIGLLKIGTTKNGYIEIHNIDLKECVEAMKEFDNEKRLRYEL